jgi:membrane-associated phospholipid phosphatase
MKSLIIGLVVLSAVPVWAQEPVQTVPDYASWVTASANPVIAVVQAFRSEDRWCRLGQLGISGGITTSVGLLGQHFIRSPRPCVGSPGCSGNGGPSMHAGLGTLGISRGFHSGMGITFSIAMAVGTAGGRVDAKRHTKTQVMAGLALGSVSEWAGQKLVRCGS